MSCSCQCPTRRVLDPVQVVYRDFYDPQIVEIIHPVEIINRHHCVPIPQHIYTFIEKDEGCPTPLTVAHVRNIKKKKRKGQ